MTATTSEGKTGYTATVMHHKTYMKTTIHRVIESIDSIREIHQGPLVCADFGTADGGLVVQICEAIMDHLAKENDEREVVFVLNDQEKNDFNTLIRRTTHTQRRYPDKVSFLISPKDMYRRCLPVDSVDIAFSTFALSFLQKIPVTLKHEMFPTCQNVSSEEFNAFREQFLSQWVNFLKARAKELRKGGYLILLTPCSREDVKSPGDFPGGEQLLSNVMRLTLKEFRINKQKPEIVTFPQFNVLLEVWLTPFQEEKFGDFRLISAKTFDSDVISFKRLDTTDVKALEVRKSVARRSAKMSKAWMKNSIISALPEDWDDEEKESLTENYFDNIEKALIAINEGNGTFPVAELVLKKE